MFGGIFSGKIELTPRLALAVSSVYMIASDGVLAQEEIGSLIAIFGGDKKIIENAVKYIQQNSNIEVNISKMASILNNEQKEIVIFNLLDILLSDGEASEQEKQLFFGYVELFKYDQAKIEQIYEVFAIKNSISKLS
jgi:uncharacterized tellurite resistance protein B-like protein